LKRILPSNQSFQDEKGSFCSKLAYTAKLKKNMYLSKEKQSMIEAQACSTLIPGGN
jgi:hypothetical protein